MNKLNLQIGKIVGSPNSRFWSQTHIFLPEDKEKRLKFGNLLASFSLKAKQDKIDIGLFGKEIISRFHEIYYSSREEGVFKKLNSSLTSLINEFSQMVEMEIVAAVVVPTNLVYLAATGKGKAFIFRENKLVKIVEGEEEKVKISSGFLKNNDLFVLGSSQFFQIISLEVLKAALENKKVEEGIESLAPIVHGHKENSQAATVIFKIELTKVKELPKSAHFNKIKTMTVIFITSFISRIFKRGLRALKTRPSFYVKDEQKRLRAKKTTLTVALILIALLIISVILGVRKRSTSQEVKMIQALIKEVNYRYEQATSLEELNPLRARSLLIGAKDLIEQSIDKIENKSERKKIEQLLQKVESELEKVAREYKLEKGDLFLDLSLAKEGFKGNNWGIAEGNLYIFDDQKGTVLQVEVENKSYQIVAGGEKLASGKLIGATGNRAFILSNKNLLVVDLIKTEIIDEIEAEDWGKIVDLVGFSSNAYLLDIEKGQIWKYRGIDSGLSKKSSYLKGEEYDLTEAVSFAIDGSVWVLFSNGEIVKFIRGKKDVFVLSGLDKPFAEPTKIYTDENLDNLYVLDRQNTRVVVVSKETGEYQAQYIWPGIAGVSDLAAFEEKGKILLLAGERIYEIEIRK